MRVEQVRSLNWNGSIPVVLTLAPSSLSSPTIPMPMHILVSRHTFLHIGLKDAVLHLQKFAVPSFSFARRTVEEPDTIEKSLHDEIGNEGSGSVDLKKKTKAGFQPEGDYPLCWFEDEATQAPLQWHLFAGVIYDALSSRSDTTNPAIPWGIKLHFSNYPSTQLLSLDHIHTGVMNTIERTFKNSLKQALVLQNGHNKTALNMTKETHQRLWNSIVTSSYSLYKPIQESIQATVNSLALIPVRVSVDPSKPFIQKRCEDRTVTLGQLLLTWLPKHFRRREDTNEIEAMHDSTTWKIAGSSPPLETLLIDLWVSLCHPDNFLYIAVAE